MTKVFIKKILLTGCLFPTLICMLSLSGCSEKPSTSSQPASGSHPETIAFSDGYDKTSVTIEKMKITDGNTGKSFETEDPQKIRSLFEKLDAQKLTFKEEPLTGGWSYSIDCTCKGIPGYFRYTLDSGFLGFDKYSGKLITGSYVAQDYNSIYKTMQNFYNELSKSE